MNLQCGLQNAIDSNSKFGILGIKDEKDRENLYWFEKTVAKSVLHLGNGNSAIA